MPEEKRIYPDKAEMAVLAMGGLLLTIIGIAIVVYNDQLRPPEAVFIAGLLGTPFFGLATIYLLFRIVSPKPVVVLSDEGLFDYTTLTATGLIRWDEIEKIVPYYFRTGADPKGQLFIAIVVKDADVIIARQPGWKKSLLETNRAYLRGYTGPLPVPLTEVPQSPFIIPTMYLPISVDDFLVEIKKFHDVPVEDLRQATAAT
jgi:hypothetical protein